MKVEDEMISKRALGITPSMTLGISTKVKSLKALGEDVLNLSIGEPDFFTPEKIKEAGINAIKSNKTKYDAAQGNLKLREAIAEKFKKDSNLDYSVNQIVVSSGAKHSITNTILAITDVGDSVIVPAPYWVSYTETLKILGVNPKIVNTTFENGFKLTKDELISAIDEKTKAVIVTNPSNPTGSVYTRDELYEIASVCLKKNILIIADEIYEKMVYDNEFCSVAELSEEIKDITIVIGGMSKSVSMTGWRIGYALANEKIAKASASLQSHLVSHPCTISQAASIVGLLDAEDEIDNMVSVYKKRRDIAMDMINAIPGLKLVKPDGAFYLFVDISFLREYIKKESLSLEVADRLLEEKSVAVIPGIAFGNDNFIRLSYATDIDTITEAIKRIGEFISEVTA